MSSAKKGLLLNVLDAQYARDCMIKGSHSVPLDLLENFVKEIPKNTEIIVYCARYGCDVSSKAWHLLDKLGFTNIRAYEGGIQEWYQHGLPVEGACEMDYLRAPIGVPQKHSGKLTVITLEELRLLLGC